MSSPSPSSSKTASLLYHRLMLPNWLRNSNNAEINAPLGPNTDLELVVLPDSRDWESILRVKLIPAGVLKSNEDITVKMKVGGILPVTTTAARAPRRDPISYMITDKNFCMGIQLLDPSTYRTTGPYRAVEGEFSQRALSNPNVDVAMVVSSTANINPDQFEFMFKPSEYYGTAYCAIDSGHKVVAQYSDSLRLDLGLWLDLYRFESVEQYTINYIEVEVYRDTPAVH